MVVKISAKMKIKNFNYEEFASPDVPDSGNRMDSTFMELLDGARESAGIPFKINSGYRTHAVDGLLLKRYKMLDLTESESLKHSFTSIQTKTNRLTSFGHISDTTAKTTKNLWNN